MRRRGPCSLCLVLLVSCGGARGAGGGSTDSPKPFLLPARAAFGVALPCVNVQSPSALRLGDEWLLVSEAGPVLTLEVTSDTPDQVCEADEEQHGATLEALDAEPIRRPEDGAPYARCSERSGLFGSHGVLPPESRGQLLVVRRSALEGSNPSVVRDVTAFDPPPPTDAPYIGLDADGDGLANWLLTERSTESSASYPAGVVGGYDCQEVYRLEAGAWHRVFRQCRHRCEPVTY